MDAPSPGASHGVGPEVTSVPGPRAPAASDGPPVLPAVDAPPGSRLSRLGSHVGDLADLAGNYHDNVTNHGMTPTEALTTAAIQTHAGNQAATAATEQGLGLTTAPSGITNVGGALATGAMLPNGLDNLMPERMAANTARTLIQGGQAVLSGEEGAVDRFAQGVRDRPGFDPFAGFARAADEAGRYAGGEYDHDASATLSDHVEVANERAADFQRQVASGGTTAPLQGLDHLARLGSEAVVDPGNAASEFGSALSEIARDTAERGITTNLGEAVDHFQQTSRQGDYGMISQGYSEIAHELGALAADPGTYAEDLRRTANQSAEDLGNWMGWNQ